ncbi:uncharacterized protein LDX57_007199 [Aspergillus melleus]|uniref:uncharacterized protein n=1 Tax=Aspergillus melleus TaxID=138277 RepID=UPI001E8D523A|nr:uncharacterized protein LDX57_007199 [Aspergillus melleus]KAH8429535.1 hypothetical protein LDX57_007199 [Aspergillus melleus]
MGHCKAKCPDIERKNRGQQGSITDKRPSLPSSLANPGAKATDTASSPPTTLRASMPPSRRVEAPPTKFDPEATLPPSSTQEPPMNSWEVVPNVVFPNLHRAICQLASRLAIDPDVYLQQLPYHSMITGHGGPQRVAEMLLEWIDPHIRALEGRVLRAEDLQARQNNLWSPNGGYVDIVTDLRNNEYWRAYPGQSKDPAGRIKTHNPAILRGSRSTLHHHVIAQGQGYRAANCSSSDSYLPSLEPWLSMC